jgi:hypothetical protein
MPSPTETRPQWPLWQFTGALFCGSMALVALVLVALWFASAWRTADGNWAGVVQLVLRGPAPMRIALVGFTLALAAFALLALGFARRRPRWLLVGSVLLACAVGLWAVTTNFM